MIVLSAEGSAHLNKGLWSTHKILGVYTTKAQALLAASRRPKDMEEVVLMTEVWEGNFREWDRVFDAIRIE